MADPSADVPRASTARPAVASMCMGRAEQKRMHQHIRRLIALFRCEFPGRHITAIVIQLNGDIRFHFADEGGAASSSSLGPAACGRPSKPGPPHSVRSPTTSNAARTSTSTSTVSRKERRRRGWQFRGICKRIASRRALLAAFHKWNAVATATETPDTEMTSQSTGMLPEAPPTLSPISEAASSSADMLSDAPSTPTSAWSETAQTTPSTGSAHCSPTLSQKRPVAAPTPGSTTSPRPSPPRRKQKKKSTPLSPPTRVSGDPKILDG
jgi:hypothetical protein